MVKENRMVINEYGDKTYKINPDTGEITEMMKLLVPIGTITRSPHQQKATREWLESKKRRAEKLRYMQMAKNELGNFYFVLTENVFDDIKPETATKLIMLCTYLDYSNRLMKTRKTPMKKSDIQKILKLSRSATYQFWNEVKDKYIAEYNGILYITDNAKIFKHSIPQDDKYLQLQKIYINAVRNLYNPTDVRKHRQLGYIFKLLPHINLEFNIFCKDPFEKELDNIEPLTVTDLCNLVNYDVTQSTRLIRELQSIKFIHNGNEEYLLSFVDNGTDNSNSKKIFVNPHIIFNGTDYRRVEVLGAFCKVNTGKRSTLKRHGEK